MSEHGFTIDNEVERVKYIEAAGGDVNNKYW